MLNFWKKKWKYKLPILIGVIYFVLWLPFITGILIPSVHEGNLYSTLFVIVILPLISLLSGFSEMVEGMITKVPRLYVSNMIFFFISWLFLVLISLFIGVFIDILKKPKQPYTTKHFV
jgi:hypothetical protein